MRKFSINGQMTVSCWTVVEAETEEEALQIAAEREVAQLSHQAMYPDDDECFHFESDGEPMDLEAKEVEE